ncbi:hypothetical protein ACFFSH_16070 [Streptomyces filamentosus]|uniref:Uncharacterized protein n=1 Tax=Streptomyces filamentosus TaxID=67294 RepID=A0A919BGW7_STRFL|nr:hypothetical protein [Streptomyces filamentosus]GHF90655.1 hypothetical protein GCM10017667_19760 [Streptomyces filamentosus]
MTGLKPFGQEVPPEARELATALRQLFEGLAPLSMRRYAIRRSYDSGAVSRYFSGLRVPHWDFVRNLLGDVAEARGAEAPTEETVAMLRALHRAALYAAKGPVHKVRLLEVQLAEADDEAQRAARSARRLEEALDDRERRIRDLALQVRELRAEPSADSGEYARLRAEIRDLEEELARVRELHRLAEERCEGLERRLAEAEAASVEGGGTEVAEAEGVSAAPVERGASRTYNFRVGGEGNVVNVHQGPAPMDEEAAAALSVQVTHGADGFFNGLLVDERTVVAVVPRHVRVDAMGLFRTVSVGERTVAASVRHVYEATGLERGGASLLVLELMVPVPPPASPVRLDRKPPIGSRLLVSTRNPHGPYSCLVDLKGRTNGLLRVEGGFDRSLTGAPFFSERGGVAGFQIVTSDDSTVGYLFPASVLDVLEDVALPNC